MKSLKKYIIGICTTFVLALAVTSVAFAHGEGIIPSSGTSNSFMGGMGMMMNSSMRNFDFSDENRENMQRMYEIMWKEGDVTREEFEWLINKRQEYMNQDLMGFTSVEEFNEWKESRRSMNFGAASNYAGNWNCPMWR